MTSNYIQVTDLRLCQRPRILAALLTLTFLSSSSLVFQAPSIHFSSSIASARTKFDERKRTTRKDRSRPIQALLDPSVLLFDNLVSPYATAALTCGVKASAADYVAQRKDARKMDLRRNFGFAIYGALYQGMALELIYNQIYPIFFGAGTGVATVTAKVAFNLLIQSVFLTLPLAYLIKGWFQNRTPRESIGSYGRDVRNKGLLLKYFSFWGPAQALTFSIIPQQFRISFIASLSFFWMILLSRLSSSSSKLSHARKNT